MSNIHIPAQNHFLQHHQCCADNLPRGLFQAAEVVLTKRNNKIYLSLFNEGKGKVMLPSGQSANIEIMGDFLETNKINVIFSLNEPEKFSLLIRTPRWSSQTKTKVNGHKQKGSASDNWITINRNWKNGDQVEISFEMDVRWEIFDPTKFKETFHDIPFYENVWAKLKFAGGSNEELNHKYAHVKSLSPDEALPHRPAVTFFYGPIALSRDVRITGDNIFATVKFSGRETSVKIRPIQAPVNIWKAFELNLGKGQKINFCDFSSAGNTWDDNSKFNTWCILE